jgi:hypothetical protein
MNASQAYGPDELRELAASSRHVEAHVTVAGTLTGVALPDWVQPGALLSAARARRLGAQLLVSADEHDAVQESAFNVGGGGSVADVVS